MKNLILIRHAKSSWDDPFLLDRDRPLNKRGKRDAPAMGARLYAIGMKPDAILASPAVRALKTARKIAKAVEFPKDRIDVREEIYATTPETLIALIACLPRNLSRVFLVGHNPELTALANRLGNAGIDTIPTCGIVSLRFDADDWGDAIAAGGRFDWFERPPKRNDGSGP